eukprot:scaffold58678_cov63-Phaeocystis_antarctica.AAC.1
MPECELPRVADNPCCAVAAPRRSQTFTRPPLAVPEARLTALGGSAHPLRETGPSQCLAYWSSPRARSPIPTAFEHPGARRRHDGAGRCARHRRGGELLAGSLGQRRG